MQEEPTEIMAMAASPLICVFCPVCRSSTALRMVMTITRGILDVYKRQVYDPIGSMFANMAAVFACEVRIERMQEIENEKRMTGLTEYDPDGYDIRFEHVTFAYREKEDVLRDVSFTAKQLSLIHI